MATATTNARSPYLIDVGNNKVVKLQLKASSLDALAPVLGLTALPANGAVPDGKVLVGGGNAEWLLWHQFGLCKNSNQEPDSQSFVQPY